MQSDFSLLPDSNGTLRSDRANFSTSTNCALRTNLSPVSLRPFSSAAFGHEYLCNATVNGNYRLH